MKVFKQEGAVVVVLLPEELNEIENEFADLATVRDEFDPEKGPQAITLASFIDAACKALES